ncbi:hypothetical protein EG328_000710 [Venturia inaequalis]|uniref:Prefoldin subunit 2 n=1 Tax=Venturia inaequalis TaxID=5025 RepID=A0A8H3UYQ2_VENIN|nr:hypothetical protein EG328_000710 [Venturia inaequalis]
MAAQRLSAQKSNQLQNDYQNYKNLLQNLAERIGSIEQETEEHKYDAQFHFRSPTTSPHRINWFILPASALHPLVLETLEPLAEDRKCFRMINGVLVERTVKEVVPALKTNSEGLKKVLDELMVQYTSKQVEMEKWKKKNKIQIVQQ